MSLLMSPRLGAYHEPLTIQATAASGTIQAGESFAILGATATAPGRFCLYRADASRIADATRPVTQDPEAAKGVLLETVHTAARLSLRLTPMPVGAPATPGAACAWAWDGPTPATITIDVLQLEPRA